MDFGTAHPLFVDDQSSIETVDLRSDALTDSSAILLENPVAIVTLDKAAQGRCRLRRWSGGDACPDDWNGGEVILRDGTRMPGNAVGYWRHHGDGHDIVTYTALRSNAQWVDMLFWLGVTLLVAVTVAVIMEPRMFDLARLSILIITGYGLAGPYVLSGRLNADPKAENADTQGRAQPTDK